MGKILVKSTTLISFADTLNRHKLVGFAIPPSHVDGINISEVNKYTYLKYAPPWLQGIPF